jgi:hypothetical protein
MLKRLQLSMRKNRLVKKKFGALFSEVEKVLFEADPIRINFGFNTDEYEAEVKTILPRLKPSCSVQHVQQIIYEEFCNWFGKNIAGQRKEYLPIARNIWILWNKHNGSKVCRGRFHASRNSLTIMRKREEILENSKPFASIFELSKKADKSQIS